MPRFTMPFFHHASAIALALASILVGMPATTRPAAAQASCFSETNFCIDQPAFAQYFESHGGARILGFPVSRTFRLEGFPVQFY